MIEIEVRFFGSLRQQVGTACQVVCLDGEARLADLVDHLNHVYGDTFGPDDRFTEMRIYYDTHPVREEVGDKYA